MAKDYSVENERLVESEVTPSSRSFSREEIEGMLVIARANLDVWTQQGQGINDEIAYLEGLQEKCDELEIPSTENSETGILIISEK